MWQLLLKVFKTNKVSIYNIVLLLKQKPTVKLVTCKLVTQIVFFFIPCFYKRSNIFYIPLIIFLFSVAFLWQYDNSLILTTDNIHTIAKTPENEGLDRRILDTLATCMTNLKSRVLVIGATTKKESIDLSIRQPGRLTFLSNTCIITVGPKRAELEIELFSLGFFFNCMSFQKN